MKDRDSLVFALPLWPLPVVIVLMMWPCLGVSLAIGTSAFTLAFVVSDLDDSERRNPFPY